MDKKGETAVFHIVLDRPEIPQNTGNIARTCAATGCVLHLVEPLGFDISDRQVKRAGLDYWDLVDVRVHASWEELEEALRGARFFFFTTKARKTYADAAYREGDALVFGRETKGLDEDLLAAHAEQCVRLPMVGGSRSLNLSNAVAVAVYEAARQNRFAGLKREGDFSRITGR